ncbi:MAG TPA: tail fiber domain-containing protein, partial [Tissierellaceae bacterium]|nr:tail fiber domain-containing protein [Tissierellaceae bacterium]
TTYSEISTAEIDTGTSATLRTITARRLKYVSDKLDLRITNLTKADIGLDKVDNTSDLNKPISTATQTALDGKLATGAQAYDSARLGGQLANLYPRRNVAETISNTWNFGRINTSGYLYMTVNIPRIEFHDTSTSQACRWVLSKGSMRLQTVEYGTSVYTGQSVNFSTLAPNNSMNLHSSGELSLLGNITAEKGTLSSLDVSGIINMGGDKVATESWVTNNFAPITPSDIRLKDNIIPIENSLDDILKLNPVHFTYKNDKTKTKKSGFIAQELREVYPQFVGGQETDTEYLNIDPANMVSVLTKGMQELIEEVRSLREELNIIKEQNMA